MTSAHCIGITRELCSRAASQRSGLPPRWSGHVFLRFSVGQTTAPWPTNGSNVWWTTGNVGIGTPSPLRRLHVVGPDGSVPAFPTIGAEIILYLKIMRTLILPGRVRKQRNWT